jgi:hypothetical protein
MPHETWRAVRPKSVRITMRRIKLISRNRIQSNVKVTISVVVLTGMLVDAQGYHAGRFANHALHDVSGRASTVSRVARTVHRQSRQPSRKHKGRYNRRPRVLIS